MNSWEDLIHEVSFINIEQEMELTIQSLALSFANNDEKLETI